MSREIEMPAAVLTSTHGADFDVRFETEGFVTLLYVGYTHCPDLCPTHMAAVARALNGLPANAAARVKVLFVTSDPERDSPSVLGTWLAQFDPSFIGLTGTNEDLVAFQRNLGMNPATTEPADHEHRDYSVNHASYVLAFPANSHTALIAYPAGTTSEDYAADLLALTSSPGRNVE
jgi:protein SCO1/2